MIDKKLVMNEAIKEIKEANRSSTRQFLEIHEIVYENGAPKVESVDLESYVDQAVVYFPVVRESFHYAICMDTAPVISLRWMGTAPCCRVYFTVHSDMLTSGELMAMTCLTPTTRWNKGDIIKPNRIRKDSGLDFMPNPEPGEFVHKLVKLLDFLEKDRAGVHSLLDKADGGINVCMNFHNGNTMLGGVHLDEKIIKRMSDQNLSIGLDLYADGNMIK